MFVKFGSERFLAQTVQTKSYNNTDTPTQELFVQLQHNNYVQYNIRSREFAAMKKICTINLGIRSLVRDYNCGNERSCDVTCKPIVQFVQDSI